MTRAIDDDDLHAYVDGALTPERRAEVEAHLREHLEDSARVRAWTEQRDGLHRLFDPILDEPIPARLHPGNLRAGLRRKRLAVALRAAAAVALILVGAAGGWTLRGHSGPLTQVAGEALAAHLVYVVEQRHPVEVAASDRDHMRAWLSKRLGAAMDVPDLAPQGWHLVGGRLLPAQSGAAALYMYEDSVGRRVTLYVRRAEAAGGSDIRFADRDGARAGTWSEGPFGCALSGQLPQDQLAPLIRLVQRQMAKSAGI